MTTVDSHNLALSRPAGTSSSARVDVGLASLTTDIRCGTAVIRLFGDHDVTNAAELMRAIEDAVVDADVIIDLDGADFIDSSVLHTLVRGRRAAAAAGRDFRLSLANGHHLHRVLEISGIGIRTIELERKYRSGV